MGSRAAILLSRQSLRPCRSDPWVAGTLRAAQQIEAERRELVSSVGMQTWELITAIGSFRRIPMRLHVTCRNEDDFNSQRGHLVEQFGLDSSRVLFLPHYIGAKDDRSRMMKLRDKAVMEDADVLFPISIRAGGTLAERIVQCEQTGKLVVREFEVEHRVRTDHIAYSIRPDELNPEIDSVCEDFVIHWTRGSNSAWPGERQIDYYRALLEANEYPRSAFHSLRSIVRTGIVYGTSKRMPGNARAVSFSSAAPSRMLPLIRYRSRDRQMSFEPYGIGIRSNVAERIGIQPVRYYDRKTDRSESDSTDYWLSQSIGERSDWTKEQEYRYKGDLVLREIPSSDLIMVCRFEQETERIQSETGITAVAYTRSSFI